MCGGRSVYAQNLRNRITIRNTSVIVFARDPAVNSELCFFALGHFPIYLNGNLLLCCCENQGGPELHLYWGCLAHSQREEALTSGVHMCVRPSHSCDSDVFVGDVFLSQSLWTRFLLHGTSSVTYAKGPQWGTKWIGHPWRLILIQGIERAVLRMLGIKELSFSWDYLRRRKSVFRRSWLAPRDQLPSK